MPLRCRSSCPDQVPARVPQPPLRSQRRLKRLTSPVWGHIHIQSVPGDIITFQRFRPQPRHPLQLLESLKEIRPQISWHLAPSLTPIRLYSFQLHRRHTCLPSSIHMGPLPFLRRRRLRRHHLRKPRQTLLPLPRRRKSRPTTVFSGSNPIRDRVIPLLLPSRKRGQRTRTYMNRRKTKTQSQSTRPNLQQLKGTRQYHPQMIQSPPLPPLPLRV